MTDFLTEKPAPLTPEQIATWVRLQFYMRDHEIEQMLEEWADWIVTNVKHQHRVSVGSSSWSSGKRFITFIFEDKGEASLFRLFCGGSVVFFEP